MTLILRKSRALARDCLEGWPRAPPLFPSFETRAFGIADASRRRSSTQKTAARAAFCLRMRSSLQWHLLTDTDGHEVFARHIDAELATVFVVEGDEVALELLSPLRITAGR